MQTQKHRTWNPRKPITPDRSSKQKLTHSFGTKAAADPFWKNKLEKLPRKRWMKKDEEESYLGLQVRQKKQDKHVIEEYLIQIGDSMKFKMCSWTSFDVKHEFYLVRFKITGR
jgi:hypothetical protein